jgi:UDP-N-acetylmuramoylalanine--D-glutamate ligase
LGAPSATWLNLAPDHLDVHATLADYEAAKARIWADQAPDDVAVGNADDPSSPHLAGAGAPRDLRARPPGPTTTGSSTVLVLARRPEPWPSASCPGPPPRRLANALAAAATALEAAGATARGRPAALRRLPGLPHRVSWWARLDGVRWYDDSKATAPHATLAAVGASTPWC